MNASLKRICFDPFFKFGTLACWYLVVHLVYSTLKPPSKLDFVGFFLSFLACLSINVSFIDLHWML